MEDLFLQEKASGKDLGSHLLAPPLHNLTPVGLSSNYFERKTIASSCCSTVYDFPTVDAPLAIAVQVLVCCLINFLSILCLCDCRSRYPHLYTYIVLWVPNL